MSDTDFPAGVHVLRPRKVSISKKLDGFLDRAGLETSDNTTAINNTRPSLGNINAMTCVGCSQVEYLTRDYCRCGHYLRGQLEDEYLNWEKVVHDRHMAVSDQVECKLKSLRIFIFISMPFIVLPMLLLALKPVDFALSTFLWMLPGIAIFGAIAFVERGFICQLQASASTVENCSFETFLEQRHRQ